MNDKELPAYFKKYLDERFDRVLEKIADNQKYTSTNLKSLRVELKGVKDHLSEINGDVVEIQKTQSEILDEDTGIKPRFERVEKIVNKAVRWGWVITIVVLILFFIFARDSREFILQFL